MGEPCPQDVREHIEADGELWGHGVLFELRIWNLVAHKKYPNFPLLAPEQVRCTSELAHAAGLPGSLLQAAPAAGLKVVKDAGGHALMLEMCKPYDYEACDCRIGDDRDNCATCYGTGAAPLWYTPERFPEKHARLGLYCYQDIVVEHGLYKRLLKLTPLELTYSLMSYEINERGITIDQESVKSAQALVVVEKARLNRQIDSLTQGAVPKTTMRARMMKWLIKNNTPLESLKAADVADSLEDFELTPVVRAALETWKEGSKTSVSKLIPMATKASKIDKRLRDAVQFNGAHTRRWAGRAVQYQNLPRGVLNLKPEDVEQVFYWLNTLPPEVAGDYIGMIYGSPMQVLSDCLRGFLVAAEGYELFSLDLAQIEARGLAWLAGDELTLEGFRTHGKHYEMEAARMFGLTLDQIIEDKKKGGTKRQAGKVGSLAFQFGGGVNAGRRMGKTNGVKNTDARWAELRDLWRESHPEVKRYWDQLENAAMSAVRNPGGRYYAGDTPGREVMYRVVGSFLFCKLPSGGVISYPYPEIQAREMPWGEIKDTLTYKHWDGQKNLFLRVTTWGGKLAENVTQSLCRDIFAEGMLRLHMDGYPIVTHNHDEAVLEILETMSTEVLRWAVDLFARVPKWAVGLPIAVTTWRGKRYRKE